MIWKNLSEDQLNAATYNGHHLLIKGFAGTGKTTVLAARAAFLLKAGVPPERIIILSPTKKGSAAVCQLALELSGSLGKNRLRSWSFQSWCQHLLDQFPTSFGIEGFSISSSEEIAMFVPHNKDYPCRLTVESFIQTVYERYVVSRVSLEDAIYWAVFTRKGFEDYAKEAVGFSSIFKKGIEDYIESKILSKTYDEVDVQNIIAVTLHNSPAAKQLVSAEVEHLLIDDVQDITPLQYEILSALASDCDLFCVGDETQSVNLTLGADWTSIRRFSKFIPGAEERILTQSFRCTQEIQELAHWVLERSPHDYRVVVPRARCLGQTPQLYCSMDQDKLCGAIAEDIQRNVTKYGYGYEDHLLLGEETSDIYVPRVYLTKHGIPCQGPATKARKKWKGYHVRQLLTPLSMFFDTDVNPGGTFAKIRKRFEDSQEPDSYIFQDRYQKEYEDLQALADQAHDINHFFQLVEENSLVVNQTGYKKDHCIQVSNIRDAKLKEADICYLWDISFHKWPKRNEWPIPELTEEKRRLLSLAISRARSKVVILSNSSVSDLEKNRGRSRRWLFFLREIGARVELVDLSEDS